MLILMTPKLTTRLRSGSFPQQTTGPTNQGTYCQMSETIDRDTEKKFCALYLQKDGLYLCCCKEEILDVLYVKRKLMAELKVCSLCRHCYRKYDTLNYWKNEVSLDVERTEVRFFRRKKLSLVLMEGV